MTAKPSRTAKKPAPPAGRWRIVLDGKELESWASPEVARRRHRALMGSMAGGRGAKLFKPNGEEDDGL